MTALAQSASAASSMPNETSSLRRVFSWSGESTDVARGPRSMQIGRRIAPFICNKRMRASGHLLAEQVLSSTDELCQMRRSDDNNTTPMATPIAFPSAGRSQVSCDPTVRFHLKPSAVRLALTSRGFSFGNRLPIRKDHPITRERLALGLFRARTLPQIVLDENYGRALG